MPLLIDFCRMKIGGQQVSGQVEECYPNKEWQKVASAMSIQINGNWLSYVQGLGAEVVAYAGDRWFVALKPRGGPPAPADSTTAVTAMLSERSDRLEWLERQVSALLWARERNDTKHFEKVLKRLSTHMQKQTKSVPKVVAEDEALAQYEGLDSPEGIRCTQGPEPDYSHHFMESEC